MEGYLGQTVGKMLLGIEVIREDSGEVPGPGTAAIRTVLRLIDGLFFYLVGFVSVLASGKNQRLVIWRPTPSSSGSELGGRVCLEAGLRGISRPDRLVSGPAAERSEVPAHRGRDLRVSALARLDQVGDKDVAVVVALAHPVGGVGRVHEGHDGGQGHNGDEEEADEDQGQKTRKRPADA